MQTSKQTVMKRNQLNSTFKHAVTIVVVRQHKVGSNFKCYTPCDWCAL